MSRYNRPAYAGKSRDGNEKEIVAALETIGCTVYRLDEPADLLVGRGAKNVLLEVKQPGKENRKDQEDQKAKRAAWKGQIAVVSTVMEAIDVVTKITVKNAY